MKKVSHTVEFKAEAVKQVIEQDQQGRHYGGNVGTTLNSLVQ